MLYPEGELVWVTFERVFGRAPNGIGAHLTLVRYTLNGIDYEVYLENDEFQTVEDLIEYDDD